MVILGFVLFSAVILINEDVARLSLRDGGCTSPSATAGSAQATRLATSKAAPSSTLSFNFLRLYPVIGTEQSKLAFDVYYPSNFSIKCSRLRPITPVSFVRFLVSSGANSPVIE